MRSPFCYNIGKENRSIQRKGAKEMNAMKRFALLEQYERRSEVECG